MKRRHESLSEQLFRYRGIALVVSVPLLLIVVVVLLMPRSSPIDTATFAEDAFDRESRARSDGSSPTEKYAVVIDAGSTGSRIHVYKFDGKLDLLEINGELELFEKIKPGLSAYKDDPKKGADSLRELIDKALKVVPETLRPSTPIRVGATAGLRLLPGDLADQILQEVRTMLNEYPFTFDADSVKILDGADEGSFAWVTVNYLLGKLGQDIGNTVAVVDLGGGSVQMTYALDDSTAKTAPEGYVRQLSGMGKTYNVYVKSYLGYGLMAARAAILKLAQGPDGHKCVVKGAKDKYKYGTDELEAIAAEAGADAAACAQIASTALHTDDKCDFSACSFGGEWSGGGGDGAKNVYVASYFFDRAGQLGVIPDDTVPSAPAKPLHFWEAAKKVCSTPLAEMATAFPKLDQRDHAFACLDVSYQHTLLTAGFGLKRDQDITLVKQIRFKGKDVEAAWPLGAAINAISA